MPRDRPTAGGQDSSLEGEFPGDFGSSSPKTKPERVSSVKGGLVKDSPFASNTFNANTVIRSYLGPSPILGVYSSVLGNGTLNGIYKFSTPYNAYYTSQKADARQTTVPSNSTLNFSESISINGNYPGQFALFVSLSPNGTGTLNREELYFSASVENLSATNFATYDLPDLGFRNNFSISSTETLQFSKRFSIAPRHKVELLASNRNTRAFAAVPNSDTDFTINASLSVQGSSVYIDRMLATAYGFSKFSANYIVNTLNIN